MANRATLEAEAVELGLVDAETYQNKPTVEKAIERVKAGESAEEVNAELRIEPQGGDDSQVSPEGQSAPVTTTDDDSDDSDEEPEQKAKGTKKKPVTGSKNQGHPTSFSDTGAPQY